MKLKIVLTFLVGMMFWFAMLGDTFTTTDYRSVKNATTGATSVPLCGPGGQGIFFNSTDTGGVSCIDPGFGFTVDGGLVWIRMQSSIYYETSCYSQFVACHLPPNRNTCDMALPWQAFRITDLGYAGESTTLGGPLVQPVPKEYVCPTPGPPSPTATTVASHAPTAISVTPTSAPSPPTTTTPLPCEGSLFGLPCPPTLTPTSVPVGGFTPPPNTPTFVPSSPPTLTPTVLKTSTQTPVLSTPTPTTGPQDPTHTPTAAAAPSLTPTTPVPIPKLSQTPTETPAPAVSATRPIPTQTVPPSPTKGTGTPTNDGKGGVVAILVGVVMVVLGLVFRKRKP